MTDFWIAALGWAAHSAGVGAAVLLLGWVGLRCVQGAAAKHLIGVWSVRAAVLAPVLCLLPAWLTLPAEWNGRCVVVAEVEPDPAPIADLAELNEDFKPAAPDPLGAPAELNPDPRPATAAVPPRAMPPRGWDIALAPESAVPDLPPLASAQPGTEFRAPEPGDKDRYPSHQVEPIAEPIREVDLSMTAAVAPLVLGAAGLVGTAQLAVLTLGYVGLWRLVRSAAPASGRVQAVFAGLTAGMRRPPRLLVSDRIVSPVCFGLLRPTVLLPRSLAVAANSAELRWVFAHELDHVRRGDPVTGAWVGLAGALYFFAPWFWLLRRDLALTQEYLADAAAAAADGRPVDYAAFLVTLSGGPGRVPFGANGVRAGKSDLFRRVDMLLNPNGRADRGWSAVVTAGVLAAAVLLSGVGFASAEDDKPKTEKVEKKVIVVGKDGERKVVEVIEIGGKAEKGERKVIVVEVEKGDKPVVGEKKVIVDAKPKALTADGKKAIVIESVKGAKPKFVAADGKKVAVLDDPKGDEKARAEAREKAAQEREKAAQAREKAEQDREKARAKAEAEKAKAAAQDKGKADKAKAEGMAAAVEELKEKIADAARKGNIEEMQQLVEKLRAVMAAQKAADPVKPVRPVPPVPPLPPDFRRFDFGRGPDVEHIKEALEKSMRSMEEALRNQPDNEQLKKAMEAYKKAMEEALKHGQHFPREFKFEFPEGAREFKFMPDGARAWAMPAGGGRLGVTLAPISEALAAQLDLKSGVLIQGVTPGSAAEKAGLKKNDIVVAFAGKEVADAGQFVAAVAEAKAGTVDAIVIRKGKKEVVKGIELAEVKKPEARKPEPRTGGSGRTVEVRPASGKSQFESVSVSINDGKFSIDASNDDVAYSLAGEVDGGKTTVSKIVVTEGKKKATYKSLEEVPAAHRDAVKQLLGSVNRAK